MRVIGGVRGSGGEWWGLGRGGVMASGGVRGSGED